MTADLRRPTNDLADWLLEQIAEDERVAQAAAPGGWEYCVDDCDGEIISDDSPHYSVAFVRGGNPRPGVEGMDGQNGTGKHVETWQPKRVLAECDAKRRIIADAATFNANPKYSDDGECMAWSALTAIALPYANREGYRAEWALP